MHDLTPDQRRGLLMLRLVLIFSAVMYGLACGSTSLAAATLRGALTEIEIQGNALWVWLNTPPPAPPPQATAIVAPARIVTTLAPAFRVEVTRWEPQILVWSARYGLDADLIATIMQVESCGDAGATSPAGAAGLFQVMPFHFAEGEDLYDPNTNAARGLLFFAENLARTQGDVGLALAAYNGGPGILAYGQADWPDETRDYYIWGTGIYGDVRAGLNPSPTLERWLAAGGASLCAQASARPVP